jgi:hypothetical protein
MSITIVECFKALAGTSVWILAVEPTNVDLVRSSLPANVSCAQTIGGNYAKTDDGRAGDLVPRGVWRT